MTPTQVLKKWNALPKERQNSKTAREHYKMCGMKSMAEVETAALYEREGIEYEYEAESLPYRYEQQSYTPDFRTKTVYTEVKGKATKETRDKLLAVKRCNPEKVIVIRFLKGRNKIAAGSKTTYLDWFRKKGFVCFDWDEEEAFIKFIRENQPKGLKSL